MKLGIIYFGGGRGEGESEMKGVEEKAASFVKEGNKLFREL